MGDPSGIGPEIIAGAGLKDSRNVRYIVIGDRFVFDKAAGGRSSRLPFQFVDLANADRRLFAFGKICAKNGKASIEYLDAAMGLLGAGEIDCLVTGPISKEAVHKAGYPYSGHTEYFAAKTGRPDAVMMLVNDSFRFSLVTRHVPLARVAAQLTAPRIRSTLRITHAALRGFFNIRHPKIIVLGINPHGSDNGVIGNEENTVIRPAVRSCRLLGVHGPAGADVAIAKASSGAYDCVLAMFHDQALIPLKLTGDKTGVNLTLGLPFVRTSPLHGTAFDIAGKHTADPSSLRAAVNLALRCVQNQRKA